MKMLVNKEELFWYDFVYETMAIGKPDRLSSIIININIPKSITPIVWMKYQIKQRVYYENRTLSENLII